MARYTRKVQRGGFGFPNPFKKSAPVPTLGSSSTMNPIPATAGTVSPQELIRNNLFTSLKLKFNERENYNPDDYAFNKTTKKVNRPLSFEDFIRWELENHQASYLSRLAYSPSGVLVNALKDGIMKMTYKNAENLITNLEGLALDKSGGFKQSFTYSGFNQPNYKSLPLNVGDSIPPEATSECGKFFPDSGCTMILYQDKSETPINPKPTLYVIFKGSSSKKDFESDIKIFKDPLKSIPQLAGVTGVDGKFQRGFYTHMANEIDAMITSVEAYKNVLQSLGNNFRLVICGHSLGGAMATLFAYILCKRGVKFGNQPIECFTFGAPTMFSDDGRNSFNDCLKSGNLLFNRIWASKDVITVIPPGLSHAGYKPSKLEGSEYSFDSTGRSVDINDIRKVFSSIDILKEIGDNPLSLMEQNKQNIQPQSVQAFLLKIHDPTNVAPNPLTTEQKTGNNSAFRNVATAASAGVSEVTGEGNSGAGTGLPPQVGGFTFGLTEGARTYKRNSLTAYPTSVHYLMTKAFSHGGYGGIGFMGALRMPNPVYPRKEPTYETIFLKANGPLISVKGDNIYIKAMRSIMGEALPTPAQPAIGAGRRRKATHKKRRHVGRKRSHKRRT